MDETVVADDGVRLWVEEAGHGDPVVFCHGGPGLWDTLDDVAGLLVDEFAVYRWDQRGAGRSQRCGPYSVQRSSADLDAVRSHFGLARAALLGHSWGAQLALEYAIRFPERVSSLVYVSGTGIDPRATWRDEHGRRIRERLGDRLARWAELNDGERTEDEDRELCVLQWSTDFARGDRALAHAERMATPGSESTSSAMRPSTRRPERGMLRSCARGARLCRSRSSSSTVRRTLGRAVRWTRWNRRYPRCPG
ncbi:alpha/beta hydrolase [Kitasatospora sp. MMS16-BH015]|uniref:alpha/beta hydrolase n=1 Tax=Kitasatospora sp. MMS16-BH015 TaxID=2018025 RepID=UPI0020C46128|nr:alpha/beta hydrolase [Kitasatospora sp. MMS16-BH015]